MSDPVIPRPPRRDDLVEVLHGVPVPDPYRWIEDAGSAEVGAWVAEQNALTDAILGGHPLIARLAATYERLWRVDDARPPHTCLTSDVALFQTRRADQDKWVLHVRFDPSRPDDSRVVLDPNTWGAVDQLAWFAPSPDGSKLAYGIARGGDENPVGQVLDLRTGDVLPDTLAGWKQWGASWRLDGSGFYYSAKPLEGEVPADEHHYWHRSLLHELGTDGASDVVVQSDPAVKERYHGTSVSEDGRWAVHTAAEFDRQRVWLQRLPDGPKIPLMAELDATYELIVLGDVFLVRTDWGAPRYRVMRGDVNRPEREHWVELVPEGEDLLEAIAAVAGRIWLTTMHHATTRIVAIDLEGRFDHEVELPEPGTAGIAGYYGKGPVWLDFQSFTHPPVQFTWDPVTRARTEVWRSPIPVDPSRMLTEQVWVTSKDGTRLPMFLVRDRDATPNGDQPVLLTGYGGFNISRRPQFSSTYVTWVQNGGMLAVPNLRGGGEYGAAWHEAGMRERKQNVFDDFIAAAEWLIASGWTRPERLAISGGSNGGLLVAAAMVQRPELFRAVLCQVPLTDMLRFHKFGIANIWALEYGSPDDPEMFPHIHAYSPVHNVREGVRWPALLVTASANDARTDPVHARKFHAAIAGSAPFDPSRPVLLRIDDASGHTGPVTIASLAEQTARNQGFLMAQLGMAPEGMSS